MEFQNSKIAWSWLYDHPKLVYTDMRPRPEPLSDMELPSTYKHKAHSLDHGLDIRPAWIDPELKEINLENESKNTKFEIWLELHNPMTDEEVEEFLCVGMNEEQRKEYLADKDKWTYDNYRFRSHDWELDCGGDTLEEAIINLAKNVLNKYGDYVPECEDGDEPTIPLL